MANTYVTLISPVAGDIPGFSWKWTISLGANSATFVPPLAAQLVGGPSSPLEIVIIGGASDGGWDGRLTVLDGSSQGSASIIWQKVFPIIYAGHQYGVGMHTYFEISDLDNDGDNEIIIAAEGGTLVLNGVDGSEVWGNPSAPGAENYVAVADVDGDGYKEVYVNEGDAIFNSEGMDWVTMLSYDGRILHQGYSWHPCWGGITIGDPAHDGNFILFQGDRDNSYANSPSEEPWQRGGQGLRALDALTLTPLWTAQEILMSSHAPMLADVDNDGIDDVVVAWQSSGIAVFNSSDGTVLDSGGEYRASSRVSGVSDHSQPTVADLDNDGHLEIVVAYESQPIVWDLYDWSEDARLVDDAGDPIRVFEPPKAGDVTGDGLLDTIAVKVGVVGDLGVAYIYSNGDWSAPIQQVDLGFGGASAFTLVQDIDNDGFNELVVTSSWGTTVCYNTPGITPDPRPRTENMFYSESRRGAAEYVPPPIPDMPTIHSEWPLDTSVNQVLNPTLSVSVADYQEDLMDITFSTDASGSWALIPGGFHGGVGNGVYTATSTIMNQYGTEYHWRVTVDDGTHEAEKTYSFTTLSNPPTQGTPSLAQGANSLVASAVDTLDPNGDDVYNVYTWYVDGVPYSNLYLPFDTRNSTNPLVTETVFSEGFESGWGGFASTDSWDLVNSVESHSGSYYASGGSSATYLVSDYFDISAGEGLTVSFWYRAVGLDDNDNVYLDYWDNDGAYTEIFSLGDREADGQWHLYSSQTFTARFNRDDFRFRIDASELDSGESIWIDDVSVVVPPRTKDYSGYGNDATIHGAEWTPDGVVGGAYVFDGETDYMRIPDKSVLDGDGGWNELTVAFWIKPLSAAHGSRIISKSVASDSNGEYFIGFQSSGSDPANTLFFDVQLGSSTREVVDYATPLQVGDWYYVVCTYKSGVGLSIYVNGTLDATSAAYTGYIFDNNPPLSVFGAPLWIGQDGTWDKTQRYFNGVLDEIQIYNRTLSPFQVMQNYVDAGSGLSTVANIRPAETNVGESWSCRVTPTDSFVDGSSLMPSLAVGPWLPNVLPIAGNLTITPSSPLTTDDLTAAYDYYDEDGDAEWGTEIRWYMNSVLQPAFNDLLIVDSGDTALGDVWYFTVEPKDQKAFGSLVTSDPVEILNSPPTVDGVSIIPDPAFEDDMLTAVPFGGFDANGDPLTYSYQWQKLVTSVWTDIGGATSSTLASSNFVSGDYVKVMVTVSDPLDVGNTVEAEKWIVDSLLPSTEKPVISGSRDDDDLTCTAVDTVAPEVGERAVSIYNWVRDGLPYANLNLPFETNSAATATDYSGYGNDGVVNFATWASDGAVGGAYSFDGDGYIRVAETGNTLSGDGGWSAISVECWVRIDGGNAYAIIMHDDGGSYSYRLRFYNYGSYERFRWYVNTGDGGEDVSTYYFDNVGEWHHVVATYADGVGLKLYIDGLLQSSADHTGTIDALVDDFLDIGDGFNGMIDEVKVYPTALSAEQVFQNYADGADGLDDSVTIVPQETSDSQTWSCWVTPNDGWQDGTAMLSDTVDITSANTKPHLDWYSPAETSLDLNVGESLNFLANASDPNGSPLTFEWTLDSIVQNDAISNPLDSNWTYTPLSASEHTVGVTVSDGSQTDYQEWTVNVIAPSQLSFDFGTSGSPVESGYTQVTESTLYSSGLGYGWSVTSGLASRDRGAPDDLRRDLIQGMTEHTFSVDLANGDYGVTVTIGDQIYTQDNTDVYAEDILKIDDLTVTAGTFQEISFYTTISDGQLNLRILDDGGTIPYWTINAVTIQPGSPPG